MLTAAAFQKQLSEQEIKRVNDNHEAAMEKHREAEAWRQELALHQHHADMQAAQAAQAVHAMFHDRDMHWNRAIADQNTAWGQKMEVVHGQLEELRSDNVELNQKVTELTCENLRLSNTVTELTGENLRLNTRVTEVTGENLRLSNMVTELDTRVDAFECLHKWGPFTH